MMKMGGCYYYKCYDDTGFTLWRYFGQEMRDQATKVLSDAEIGNKDILFFEISPNNQFIAFGFDQNGLYWSLHSVFTF